MHSRIPLGVRPRLEGKQRTLLSSRVTTRISWSPLVASVESSLLFILERGLGIVLQAMQEKKSLHIARTGASQGFPRAAAPVGVFSQGTARISGRAGSPHPLSPSSLLSLWPQYVPRSSQQASPRILAARRCLLRFLTLWPVGQRWTSPPPPSLSCPRWLT